MPEIVLLETGPLVALLDDEEEYHEWATGSMRRLKPPLLTCEAVLTETCFLLRSLPRARLQMRLWIQSGFVRHAALNEAQVVRALALMERYANVPMSFADGCLVALAESTPDARIFTLDRDFLIYRQREDKPLAKLLRNQTTTNSAGLAGSSRLAMRLSSEASARPCLRARWSK